MATPTKSDRPDLASLRIEDGQRQGDRSGRRAGWAAAAAVAAIVILGAVFVLRPRAPQVEVAVAQEGAAGRPALLNASGYVTPRRKATIASKVTGRVTGVFFDEGMHVKGIRSSPRWTIPMRDSLSNRPRQRATRPRPPLRTSTSSSPTRSLSSAGPSSSRPTVPRAGKRSTTRALPSTA